MPTLFYSQIICDKIKFMIDTVVNKDANIAITATPEALKHFKKQLAKSHATSGIRLDIVKAGCSGYRYEMKPIDENNPVTEQDKQFQLDNDLLLYVSRKIFPSVMGTVIDYQKKGLSGELVFNNPQQTGACGCGESITFE